MGNASASPVDIDDDLLARAGELLKEASARKRTREDELPPPAPMFALPTPAVPSLPKFGKDVDDEYATAVLSAATAYLTSGGKACKPVKTASAGSIGRKAAAERSDSTIETNPAAEAAAMPPAADLADVAAPPTSGDAVKRQPTQRTVVYKCRKCGSGKRAHECPGLQCGTAGPGPTGEARLRPWTTAEDQVIANGVTELGYKWSSIASRLEGRTDNAVRNRWHRIEAARKWRAEMEARNSDELPGYKCGRCGQPKRGHTCPYSTGAPEQVTDLARDESASYVHGDDHSSASPGPVSAGADAGGEERVDVSLQLAELFASLDACPAEEPAVFDEAMEDDVMCEFVQSMVSPEHLEDMLSGSTQLGDSGTLEWRTRTAADGTTWREACGPETGGADAGLHGMDDSADGGVYF